MELSATTREVLGKKVRFLRRQGITPANLFGHNVESVALQCDTAELNRLLPRTGKTGIVNLKIDRTRKPRNVMVREVQREPRTGELLHVDLYQVSMEEKIRVEVPIVPVGEAPALKLKENFFAQELHNLNIECLPDKVPGRIELDISALDEADQALHVRDIVLDDDITILDNPERLVAKISTRFVEKEREEEKVKAEVAAKAPEAEPKGRSSES
ncbi:MAG: 50S ribosomal protein L25 [Dehalococcoidales bacterium]|nr:50S ribosomal protein L25 [Dehalococcoidales bacterium]